MKDYIRAWNVMRLFRLVMGIIVVIQGLDAGYWMIVGIGIVFVGLSLLNVSTCNTPICKTSYSRSSKSDLKDITYEEVK